MPTSTRSYRPSLSDSTLTPAVLRELLVLGDSTAVRTYPPTDIEWCVLAIDGAQRGLDHHHADWTALPDETGEQLRHGSTPSTVGNTNTTLTARELHQPNATTRPLSPPSTDRGAASEAQRVRRPR
jgi:hypothetical protein